MTRLWTLALLLIAGCSNSGADAPSAARSAAFQLTAKASREEKLDLDLKSGERLMFKNSLGDFTLHSAAGEAPRLSATISTQGRDQAEADSLLTRYKLAVERSADTVTIRVIGEPAEIKSGGATMMVHPNVTCDVVVPPGVRLDLSTKSGFLKCRGPLAACVLSSDYGVVEAAEVEGDVRARSASGNVTVARTHGTNADISSNYGAISMTDIRAKTVLSKAASGNVTARRLQADSIKIESSYGSIDLNDATGDIDAKSKSGSVTLRAASKGKYTLNSGYGAIVVHDAEGPLDVQAASGNITVDGCRGQVNAKSDYGTIDIDGVLPALSAVSKSGSVRVKAQAGSKVGSDWSLRTDYGGIELTLPPAFDAMLDAKTKYGEIKADASFQLERTKAPSGAAAHGKLGQGGATITLEAASGSIQLRRSAK